MKKETLLVCNEALLNPLSLSFKHSFGKKEQQIIIIGNSQVVLAFICFMFPEFILSDSELGVLLF